MSQPVDPLEILWDALLSRQPERIRAVFAGLDLASQANVLVHLKRMATEEDWHPEQRASALAAIAALAAIGQDAGAPKRRRRQRK